MISYNYSIQNSTKNALLINPPVYNISDFKLEYCQPTGLLKISSLLKKGGARVELIDCLEDISERYLKSYFYREGFKIPLYHYGLSFDRFKNRLMELSFIPDEIYVTIFATYWYKSAKDTIAILRSSFPEAKIIIGGIYPTLLPEHAEENLDADIVVSGEIMEAKNVEIDLDLYDNPKYMGLKPTKGCPHNCGYCAQKIINKDGMSYRDPKVIADEMQYRYSKGIKQFYIFSENFLFNKSHFKSLLYEIIKRKLDIKIGAPKGMEPRLLDIETLCLMKQAGWFGLRLALETISKQQRINMGRRYNDVNDYVNAIYYAKQAGFSNEEFGTFLLYGLPDENIHDIIQTAEFIHNSDSFIVPMAFTPVPKSKIYNDFIDYLHKLDLTELRGRLYPFSKINKIPFKEYINLENYFSTLNRNFANRNHCIIDMEWMKFYLDGAFARSEIAFAMNFL